MSNSRARIQEFEAVLTEETVDVVALKKLAFNGIPGVKGLRPLCWRYLLNYLPPDRSSHEATLKANRLLYNQFVEEVIVLPTGHLDHPLNVNPDSSWDAFFKENEFLLQINKDARRLFPMIQFFRAETHYPCLKLVENMGVKRLTKKVERYLLQYAVVERKGVGATKICDRSFVRENDVDDYESLPDDSEAHWEVVERMLFLYAKLNPGLGYVQGMNEVIAHLYYTFATDPNVIYRENAEADCFFSFTNLMKEIRDHFISSLDETEGGINRTTTKLSDCLKRNDPSISNRFESQGLKFEYFGFRWLALLLSQEFNPPDVMRLWDSLFGDEERFKFLINICCAMIILLKNELMEEDFATNVKLLQNFPMYDMSIIISKAVEISKNDSKSD